MMNEKRNRSGGYPPYMRGIPSWQPPHIGEAPLCSVRKLNHMGRDTPICGGKAVLKPLSDFLSHSVIWWLATTPHIWEKIVSFPNIWGMLCLSYAST